MWNGGWRNLYEGILKMPKVDLGTINSFSYVIAPSRMYQSYPNFLRQIESTNLDLVILGNYDPRFANGIKIHSAEHPLNKKLLIGYVDIAESTALTTQLYLNINSTNAFPSWFGNKNTAFSLDPNPLNHLYTVQFWRDEWFNVLKRQIDDLINLGFDGIFLDVLTAPNQWSKNNPYNNIIVEDADAKMGELVSKIKNYISSKSLAESFYIIGNNPHIVAEKYPSILEKLDFVFNETGYWIQSEKDGSKSAVAPYSVATTMQYFDEIYASKTVLGNDYPPLSNPAEVIKTIKLNNGLGWITGVQKALQSDDILFSGPFITTATEIENSIYGNSYGTNYLSGGSALDARLNGGIDTANYFISGPLSNTFFGGNSVDIAHMHAQKIYKSGSIEISVSREIKSAGTVPSITAIVNGNTAINKQAITADQGVSEQIIKINIDPSKPVDSLRLVVEGTSYVDQANYSNVHINYITINGINIDLATGIYSSGSSLKSGAYSNSGTIDFKPRSQATLVDAIHSKTIFHGGSGIDTAVYDTVRSDFIVTGNINSTNITSSKYLIDDVLSSVERIRFVDTTVALDIDGNAGQAYRLYQAALDRTPDERGLAGWIKFMDEGGALKNMAQQFIDSQEFRTKYGTLDDRNFVNQLYLNVLDRNGEPAGIAGWVGGLANGLTRADVLKGFSESSENQANVIGQIKNGIPYVEWWLA
jgi:uncharacterized protein (TIGR01370 family)